MIVTGWAPDVPPTDDGIFELLTAAVFQARFRPDIVRARWPAIRAAFAGFRIAEVASWSDERADALLEAPGVIRNRKKIVATIRNARELARLGDVRAWMARFPTEDALVEAIDAWAHYVGAPSIRWFVRATLSGRPSPAIDRSP